MWSVVAHGLTGPPAWHPQPMFAPVLTTAHISERVTGIEAASASLEAVEPEAVRLADLPLP